MSEQEAEVRELPRELGTADRLQDLLARAEEEAAYSEIRQALASGVRDTRRSRRISQQDVADLIGSSQPRVSMMEAANPSVSVNLMIRTLLRLGAKRPDLVQILSASVAAPSARIV